MVLTGTNNPNLWIATDEVSTDFNGVFISCHQKLAFLSFALQYTLQL